MRPRRLPRFAPPTVAEATAAQEAKAEVYKELRYRLVGMVGQDLTVARLLVKAKGHIVQVIEPGGNTVKTLTRYRK